LGGNLVGHGHSPAVYNLTKECKEHVRHCLSHTCDWCGLENSYREP